MGVRGLTTYITTRLDVLKNYELKNTLLVIDGNGLAHHLYNRESQLRRCKDCFGGDYDKYGRVVKDFFQLLSYCNITPIVVVDGALEERKLATAVSRLKSKIKIACALNSTTNSSESIYPLFIKRLFVQTVLELKIQCICCTYEADSEVASLGKALQCPVLSDDSDFFIFDVLYIPLSYFNATRQMRYSMQTKNLESFIKCKMYNVEDFLNVSGIKKVNLSILAMLLGNDYNNSEIFSGLFNILGVPQYGTYNNNCNRQQKKIDLVVSWLKHENYESAVKTILSCCKVEHQIHIEKRIADSQFSYAIKKSEIINYVDLDITLREINSSFDEMRINNDGDRKTIEEEMDSNNRSTSENNDISEKNSTLTCLPPQFISNYRKCNYPAYFMTVITLNKYCLRPQIEDISEKNAHNISHPIVEVIYKILTSDLSKSGSLTIYDKAEHSNGVNNYQLEESVQDVPSLKMIYELSSLQCKEIFFRLLNINKAVIKNLENFPRKWHLILITFNYWTRNSNVEDCFIYAILLCGIVLSYVDINIHKHRLYRTREEFSSRYYAEISKELSNVKNGAASKRDNISLKNLRSSLEDINYVESILCMHNMISYFETDLNNNNIFDRSIVHRLSQFQSCLSHIMHLNELLNKPIDNILLSEFYNGTFIYNVLASFKNVKNKSSRDHIKWMLKDCPKIASILRIIVDKAISPSKPKQSKGLKNKLKENNSAIANNTTSSTSVQRKVCQKKYKQNPITNNQFSN